MSGNRAAAQAFVLEYIEKLIPGSQNTKIYSDLFATMNDEQFEQFVTDIETGKSKLAIIAPNLNQHALSVDRNVAIAKELGHEFFERVWLESPNGGPNYLSVKKYLVIDLPLRRQAQLLIKKISIPDDNRSIDHMTGQPTGNSKGSKISYPELQILAALQLDHTTIELVKYRGGDTNGFNAMNDAIAKTGGVSLDALDQLGTKVKSTSTLQTFLTGMHLRNTL
jgi:hypothetical protein